jgi:uncharacterized membrane protein
MSTLIVLIFSFGILWLLNMYALRRFNLEEIGRASLALMLLFTGIAHFYKTGEMVQMMPAFLPNKLQWVYLTGVVEVAAAGGLLMTKTVQWTSIGLILFFLAILPANIIGSLKKVELGGMENGPAYLYFRIPLQFLFIGWTYYFGIYLREIPLKKKLHTNTPNS